MGLWRSMVACCQGTEEADDQVLLQPRFAVKARGLMVGREAKEKSSPYPQSAQGQLVKE